MYRCSGKTHFCCLLRGKRSVMLVTNAWIILDIGWRPSRCSRERSGYSRRGGIALADLLHGTAYNVNPHSIFSMLVNQAHIELVTGNMISGVAWHRAERIQPGASPHTAQPAAKLWNADFRGANYAEPTWENCVSPRCSGFWIGRHVFEMPSFKSVSYQIVSQCL